MFSFVSTFVGYLILLLKSSDKGDKGVHSFLMGISPKVNVIALVKFELTYLKVAALMLFHKDYPRPHNLYRQRTVFYLLRTLSPLNFDHNNIYIYIYIYIYAYAYIYVFIYAYIFMCVCVCVCVCVNIHIFMYFMYIYIYV